MNDVSVRRRWSGRLLIGAAALAMPLTGSISYAQDEVAPVPPVPPAPPAAAVAPTAPVPPAPPVEIVTRDGERRVIRIERRVGNRDGDDAKPGARKRIEKRIILRDGEEMTAEERADFEADMKDYRADMADYAKDMAEHAQDMAELRRELAAEQVEIHRELAVDQAEIQREVRLAIADAHRSRPQVRVQCRNGQREVSETVTTRDGQTIFVCQALAMAEARKGLAEARAEIRRTRELSAQERAEALRSIDEAEREMRAESRAD